MLSTYPKISSKPFFINQNTPVAGDIFKSVFESYLMVNGCTYGHCFREKKNCICVPPCFIINFIIIS